MSAAPPRKPIAINIHSVTADGIKASQSAKAAEKSGKKDKGKEKMSDLLTEQVVRGIMKKGREKAPPSREQKEYISRGGKFDPKQVDPNFVTPDEKEAQWYARKIMQYYSAFPEKLGKMPTVKQIDPRAPGALVHLREHLQQIQSAIGNTFSEELCTMGLMGAGTALSLIWQAFFFRAPWNPMGHMSLAGLGPELVQMYDYFEDELKELQILYSGFFEQGLWTRIASKVFFVMQKVADKNAEKEQQSDAAARDVMNNPEFAGL